MEEKQKQPRPPHLIPFDRDKATRIYRRNLPHWRQEGATYFVTFRLADSVPKGIRDQWEDEKRDWLADHKINYDGPNGAWHEQFEKLPYPVRSEYTKHFNRQAEACLDRGYGECWLKRGELREILRAKLESSDAITHHLGDFVLMPNHAHLLLTPNHRKPARIHPQADERQFRGRDQQCRGTHRQALAW